MNLFPRKPQLAGNTLTNNLLFARIGWSDWPPRKWNRLILHNWELFSSAELWDSRLGLTYPAHHAVLTTGRSPRYSGIESDNNDTSEDMILALTGQFKQLSHEPEKFRWLTWFQIPHFIQDFFHNNDTIMHQCQIKKALDTLPSNSSREIRWTRIMKRKNT